MTILVTRIDAISLGFCNPGVRAFFASHGISWSQFLQNGLPIEAFDKVKTDPMVARLIAAAERRYGQK